MEAKPLFIERMKKLLGEEYGLFMEINKTKPKTSIRCNTLKISPEQLKKRLEKKGWKINQKYREHPEIMLIENELSPGELGNTEEHKSGLFYVQELTSMMPAIALNPGKDDSVLDLCASPGSKTTQIASLMENKGILISNDDDFGRVGILNINLERCGVSNSIITKEDAVQICNKFKKLGYKFDWLWGDYRVVVEDVYIFKTDMSKPINLKQKVVEHDSYLWTSKEEALQRLTYENTRQVLELVDRKLRS